MNKLLLYQQLQHLEDKPGIYQYFDSNSRLLYVGKAKNLKKRIKSYFNADLSPNPNNSRRIQHMVAQIHSIHVLVVANEKEALILENSFIKSQNPKYNILLRDDKTYPYITININDSYPRFSITRHIVNKKGMFYFGPYPRGIKEILASLYEIFPLVQQASCLKGKKACLYYQIEKCLGVCEYHSDSLQKQYNQYIQEAIELMQNKHKMRKTLEAKMLDFANKELFEQAQVCKNCLEILQEIEHFSVVDIKRLYNADVLSFVFIKNRGVLLKLFVRNGKVISSHHIFVRANVSNYDQTDDRDTLSEKDYGITQEFEYEVYTQALLKILQEENLCEEIILANITESHFKSLQDSVPEIAKKLTLPKRGDKLKLAQLAYTNALHLLTNTAKLHDSEDKILKDIANLFLFKQDIHSIEVFDTSHHGGDFAVGAMISYSNNEFYREHYRHYNLEGKDEYTQMREMLMRRAKAFDTIPAPNLWLLDGGIAQINLAVEILQSCNANVEVLAIAKEKRDSKAYRAKGLAKDILRSKELEFRLDSHDVRLQFLQKLRDEAHRFAISFHRHKKIKNIYQ